ncbi:MAG TPA: hypothetical protein VHH13_02395 [Arthrobacter sp.]|nr:hypothetical protein [Arthrobacter sp.]
MIGRLMLQFPASLTTRADRMAPEDDTGLLLDLEAQEVRWKRAYLSAVVRGSKESNLIFSMQARLCVLQCVGAEIGRLPDREAHHGNSA